MTFSTETHQAEDKRRMQPMNLREVIGHVESLPPIVVMSLADGPRPDMERDPSCHVCNILRNLIDPKRADDANWLLDWHESSNPIRCGAIYGIAAMLIHRPSVWRPSTDEASV